MLRTSILLEAGSRQGVQFQSPPTIIGYLEALLNILLRSAKNFGHGLLGPYTAHITNSAPCVCIRRARIFSLLSLASARTETLRLDLIKIPAPLLLVEEL